jgi:hypothetical protein
MSFMPAYGHNQPQPVADLSSPLIPPPLMSEPVQLISTQGSESSIEKVSSGLFRICQTTNILPPKNNLKLGIPTKRRDLFVHYNCHYRTEFLNSHYLIVRRVTNILRVPEILSLTTPEVQLVGLYRVRSDKQLA